MRYIYDVHKISYPPFPSSPYSIFAILFSLQLYALFGLKETALFFFINNVRILLIIERLQTEYIEDVLWGHKSENKRTTVKKQRKGGTRKMRKNYLIMSQSCE